MTTNLRSKETKGWVNTGTSWPCVSWPVINGLCPYMCLDIIFSVHGRHREAAGTSGLIHGLLQEWLMSPPFCVFPCSSVPPSLRLSHEQPLRDLHRPPGLLQIQQGKCGLLLPPSPCSPSLCLPLLSRPFLPSRLQFQRSCRNWN